MLYMARSAGIQAPAYSFLQIERRDAAVDLLRISHNPVSGKFNAHTDLTV